MISSIVPSTKEEEPSNAGDDDAVSVESSLVTHERLTSWALFFCVGMVVGSREPVYCPFKPAAE